MKLTKSLFLPTLILLLLSSCGSQKDIAYMQDGEYLKYTEQPPFLYDAHILPKDLLTITVHCSEPELAAPFNLNGSLQSPATTGSTGNTPQQTYLVDNNGDIDFPILGKLHLGGLTKGAAETVICERLKAFLKEEPIVNVRMVNYKFSVLGEVGKPNTFTVANEKVNVFEALAMAGDMTVYGLRDNVRLIREDADGHQHIITLNMNRADIIQSPYYYLQQNDILYVTPNKTKAKTADISASTTIWFSVVSTLVSLASMIITIAK